MEDKLTVPAPEAIIKGVKEGSIPPEEAKQYARYVLAELRRAHKEDWCAAGQALAGYLQDVDPDLAAELKKVIDLAHKAEEVKLLTLRKVRERFLLRKGR